MWIANIYRFDLHNLHRILMMSLCIVEYVGCVGVGFNSLCFIGYRRRPSGGFSCVSVTGQNPHRHKNKYQKIKNKNKKRKEINDPLSACVGLVFSSSFFCWFFLSSVLVSFTLLGNNLSAAAAAACVYCIPKHTHTESLLLLDRLMLDLCDCLFGLALFLP